MDKEIYSLEVLPRYGTRLGVIWRQKDAIGNIRIPNEVEEELWKGMIEYLNEMMQEKIENYEIELENETS